jgi:hypothetical protein
LILQISAFNKRKAIRRRLKSYGGTGEKAQSRQRDEQYILKRFVPLTAGLLGLSPDKMGF